MEREKKKEEEDILMEQKDDGLELEGEVDPSGHGVLITGAKHRM